MNSFSLSCFGFMVVLWSYWGVMAWRHRKLARIVNQLHHCNLQLLKAIERGDLDAAQRWCDRFDELYEAVKLP